MVVDTTPTATTVGITRLFLSGGWSHMSPESGAIIVAESHDAADAAEPATSEGVGGKRRGRFKYADVRGGVSRIESTTSCSFLLVSSLAVATTVIVGPAPGASVLPTLRRMSGADSSTTEEGAHGGKAAVTKFMWRRHGWERPNVAFGTVADVSKNAEELCFSSIGGGYFHKVMKINFSAHPVHTPTRQYQIDLYLHQS